MSTPAPFPPVVDLGAPDAPETLDRACREVGFFQAVGHGIPDALVADVFAVADEFFGRPLPEKVAWSSPTPEVERGYSAKGTEGFAYTLGLEQPPDLFEAFTVGREPVPDLPAFHKAAHTMFSPNIWPEQPERMRGVLLEYWHEASRVAHLVTGTMARALRLDPDFFEPYTDASIDTLRVNFFEGRPGDTAAVDQFGIGPHTDYGICTVLLTDHEPGLQVFAGDEWRPVTPVPGAVVVNVGDLLARWTNDHWRSTLHRVMPVLPTGDEVRRRRSLPFFHEGNYDALVECLPTCTGPGDPPRYPPITGGEHVYEKLLAGRLLSATAAESTVGDRAAALG
jgi:isopenicillin N synthase-like dioxygenase